MKKILFIVIVCMFFSCEQKSKYSYIEIIDDESLLGDISEKEKEPRIIEAISDSIAYLDAYQKFCVSKKVNQDMIDASQKVYSTPKSFKLLDATGKDIALVNFIDKEKLEKEVENRIFSLENNIIKDEKIRKKEDEKNFQATANIDSSKIRELKKYFVIKSDEFSNENKKWYTPSNAPKYTNMNGIYFYFQTENNIPSNLRFRLQYYADDWLFFDKVQFSIDNKAFDYVPTNTETDSGDGGYIWEWFDEGLTITDRDLVYALANAKTAKVKLIGDKYYDIKTITKKQILNFKRTLDLYNAMGGNY
ncbi:hypothetical protein AAEO56_09620 [Flavobacterium sp. DGU11]|uniref:Uncharacterized protein n=1 Tax=Flavobacterium arundinis TaxID=3139143 RepID=A0ABU9HWG9_9FLAO